MIWRYLLCVAVILIAFAGGSAGQSPVAPSCISLAKSRIKPGSKITIVPVQGQPIRGILASYSPLDSAIAVAFWNKGQLQHRTLNSSGISQLKYHTAGRFRILYPIMGFIAGLAIGHFAERVIFDPGSSPGPFKEWTHRGSFYGGLSGAVTGIGLSFIIPTSHVLKCP
jgi:hypothetical protein